MSNKRCFYLPEQVVLQILYKKAYIPQNYFCLYATYRVFFRY